MPRYLKKDILTNCILLLFSIIFSIFIAEFFLWSQKGEEHHKLFCEYDPLLGWRHKPNTSAFYMTSEYKVKESFNSKGIRGPEYPYEKSMGEFRILILGDSYAEGYSVDFENLFSEILNKGLKNKKINCMVINAGTAAYSTDQEFLFFKNEGEKYKPDLTVLMFCDNDVWYNNQPKFWLGYKPLFKVVGENLILTNTPCPIPDIDKLRVSPKPKNVKGWLVKHSRVYYIVRDFIRNNHWLFKIVLKLHLAEGPEFEEIPVEFGIWKKNYDSAFKNAWNVTEAVIVELKKEAFLINSKLLVFYIPADVSIYERDWQILKERYGINDKEWNKAQAGLVLKDICKKHDIDFVDPTENFRIEADRLGARGKRLYFAKDGHWTILGHDLVGKFLADFIYERYAKNKKE